MASGGSEDTTTTASSDKPAATSEATAATVDTPTEQPAPAKADVPREYRSALKKAGTYVKTMHMSKRAVYDQLTSEYGEKFSPEAAQYAVDNLEADYNEAALKKAEHYQSMMAMSPDAIFEQLTSDYGEKFTTEEAQYAIDHLSQ